MNEKLKFSGDVSYYNGGPSNGTNYYFKETDVLGIPGMDSIKTAKGTRIKRELFGADFQIALDNPIGITTLRAEYYAGNQPGTAGSSTSQVAAVSTNAYLRSVQGYYVYLVQNFCGRHQFVVKYDVWDPNTKVSGMEISDKQAIKGQRFTSADVKYSTLGLGYAIRLDENTKFTVYYDHITNEKTNIKGFAKDLTDNTLTLRLQYKF